jgi:hypothetical protein
MRFERLNRCHLFLSETVLDTEFTAGIFPIDRAIDAGNHAGAAFETACEFHDHLSFFIKGIEVGRTGINAEPFLAGMTDVLVEEDMGFLIVFEGI